MVNFQEFKDAEVERPFEANRLLFNWLSNDDDRAALYKYLRTERPVLKFQSRADTKLRPTDDTDSVYQQDVYLLTARADIIRALTLPGNAESAEFSNSPYHALGSGTFMLGLDKDDEHEAQRKFAAACFGHLQQNPAIIEALSKLAFAAGAVLPLKQRNFDLADLAEQVALRFVAFLFGFAQADHPLIEATMRKAYLGLNYQIVGRHFVTQPGDMQGAANNMGTLLQRVACLIDLYGARVGREQEDEYATIKAEREELQAFKDGSKHPLAGFDPVLKRIAEQKDHPVKYSTTEMAVIVVGLIAGTIGNVQASVSIAMDKIMRDPKEFETARQAAFDWRQGKPQAPDVLKALIREALRLNPPAAFLPRRTLRRVDLGSTIIPEGSVVILAMGGATRDLRPDSDRSGEERDVLDPLIFGGPWGENRYLHQCVGQRLVMPLIAYTVRQVLLLEQLTQSLDPRTGEPLRLEKLWGIICQKFPLEYKREFLLTQSPLNVIMKVRIPVSEHAEALKKVIKYGAPRIEKKLRDAGHVHFAQFLFLENDTKLALFTWYDRDFDSYIEHFATEVGPLFDRIFEHIQDPPPLPVNEFPKEFADTIRRYNARPAGEYIFSAYPNTGVASITQHFARKDA
jgi:cytochrome P450